MKIIFITSSSIQGGAQKHIHDMFIGLYDRGHEMYLVAPDGWLIESLLTFEPNIFILKASVRNVKELEKIFEKVRPDIVNTFILSGGCFGYIAWLRKKYGKIYITVNNPIIYQGIRPWNYIAYPILYKLMAKKCTAFLVKSDTLKNEVEHIISHKNRVISIKNGIDLNRFNKNCKSKMVRRKLGISDDSIVLTNIGNLEPRKGHAFLLDAIALLINDGENVCCLIVGEGSERKRLKEQIKEKELESAVYLLGKRSDIVEILGSTDIFVLPSLHEGLPNALMEAMAMQIPCIATDVGGVRQLLKTKDIGRVIEPGSVEAIYQNIQNLIYDKGRGEKMGKNAFKIISQEYQLKDVIKELEEIYMS